MPKLKSHRGVRRRFKITGTGKLMRLRAGRRHLMTGKPSKRTRAMRRSIPVDSANQDKLRRLFGI